MAITAVVKSRQAYGGRERVKMIVTLEDGTVQDYWPYKTAGISDVDMETEAVANAQQRIDEEAVRVADEEATRPIERTEVDALVARMKAAGLVTGDTYDAVRGEVLVAREVTR